MPVYIVAVVCIALLLYHFVARPTWRATRVSLPADDEWRRLADTIPTLTRDLVDEASDHDAATRTALRLVLTSQAGYGRLSAIPSALDHLQAPFDMRARLLRAAGSQAIVIGLIGTVAVFAWTFWTAPEGGLGAQSSDGGVSMLLEHLGFIYFVNFICLFLAVFLLHASVEVKRKGERACLDAASAFYQLEDNTSASLAPELATALESTARQFQRFSEQLFRDQFGKIESLMGEIQTLGTTLRELVTQAVERTNDERGAMEALSRQNGAAIEALTLRLDQGFQLLAQPFLEGIPATKALVRSCDALQRVAVDVVQANIGQHVTQLRDATNIMQSVVESLPGKVTEGVAEVARGVERAASEGTKQGVAQSLSPFIGEVQTVSADLAERVRGTLSAIGSIAEDTKRTRRLADDSLLESVNRQAQTLTANINTASASLTKLDDDVRHLAKLVAPQLEGVTRAVEAVPQRLEEAIVRIVASHIPLPTSPSPPAEGANVPPQAEPAS